MLLYGVSSLAFPYQPFDYTMKTEMDAEKTGQIKALGNHLHLLNLHHLCACQSGRGRFVPAPDYDSDEELARAMQESLDFQYQAPHRTPDTSPIFVPPVASIMRCAISCRLFRLYIYAINLLDVSLFLTPISNFRDLWKSLVAFKSLNCVHISHACSRLRSFDGEQFVVMAVMSMVTGDSDQMTRLFALDASNPLVMGAS